MLILSPFIILVMILIFFADGTPIFFAQRRVGINNQIFFIYKFRTMKNNLKDIPTHLISSGENLYTRSGPFLRKFSLDELPQLFNIFKGDMNFIGPRPALYNQEDLIDYRTKLGIHTIKTGLTGWAQINGRDDLTIEEKVLKDKYYMKIILCYWI